MPHTYFEDVQSLAAEYPFSIVLRDPPDQVILIPASVSRSNYDGAKVVDEIRIRRILSAAASDYWVISALRRMSESAIPGWDILGLNDSQVLDATAMAVANNRIYAVVAKGQLAESHRGRARNLTIDYHAHVSRLKDAEAFERFCSEDLPDLWCKAYREMPNAEFEIVQVTDGGYEFLFDLGADRVVAAFGTSQFNPAKRDSERMKDFLGKTTSKEALNTIVKKAPSTQVAGQRQQMAQLSWRERFFLTYGHKYDRGHFMSHKQGGGLDINLFPQRADINQGHGRLGAHYRAMEKECVHQAEQGAPVFCFSRPIYDDESWVPAKLDYGIIYGPQRISVATFPNK
ncbi:MAG TPA: hypothetical protein VIH87_13610 [Methylocella sp.]